MKIALIGDSHTQVTFDLLIPILEQAGHTIVGRVSKAGWSAKSYLDNPQHIENAVAGDPDLVLVSLGGNNFSLSDQYGQTVQRFLQAIDYPKKRVLWIGPFIALRDDVEKRHKWTTEWLSKNLPSNIPFIDTRPVSKVGHRSDNVHFTSTAYRNMVNTLKKQILSSISLSPALYYAKRKMPLIVFLTSLGLLGYVAWRKYGNTR